MKFGHVAGVNIGDVFSSRRELHDGGVHAPLQAGIDGNSNEGACSIVLSGGYEDDIDDLEYILYTGQGGQDKSKRQVLDQEFTRGNKGLQLSYEYKLPVRVTRGHQIENGPNKGYRYDGLYYVTFYERVRGRSGHYICRFHLQSELTIQDLEQRLGDSLSPDYKRPSRAEVKVNKLNRNISLREKIKQIYDYQCQVCNVLLEKPDGAIAVGAHIQGLGRPHNGPDVIENMMCLCPNHHAQFDAFSFYIEPSSLEVVGLDGFENTKIKKSNRHKLDIKFLEYHKTQYKKKTSD